MTMHSVVVRYDPAVRRRWYWLLAALGLLVLAGTYWVGGAGTLGLYRMELAKNRALDEQLAEQAQELETLRQLQANNAVRLEVDAQALELLRQQLAAQGETIAELNQGIHFYKSLMAPEELSEGMSIRGIDLVGMGGDRYRFSVLVQQGAVERKRITGTLNVRLEGSRDGSPASYNLAELSAQIPKADIRLRFKYFQAVEGELTLPDGFTPEWVHVVAKSSNSKQPRVSETLRWAVQEELGHAE